ncbi:helix-turn-helix domain-containing protein [archaeon]|nr:helix-turn-helix domain-containing protein [archaeon]
MWRMKYEYRHRDCRYLPKADEFGIVLHAYPLLHFEEKGAFYVTAIHVIEGKEEGAKKYVKYIKSISEKTERISSNILFTRTKITSNKEYYRVLYSPYHFYPTPILHTAGKEHGEIVSWEREPLARIINVMQSSPNTEFFRLLSFRQEKVKDIFLMKIIPKLTSRQREAFELALKSGYYNYPRKVDIESLARAMRISKSSYHELLRRAESHLFNVFYR